MASKVPAKQDRRRKTRALRNSILGRRVRPSSKPKRLAGGWKPSQRRLLEARVRRLLAYRDGPAALLALADQAEPRSEPVSAVVGIGRRRPVNKVQSSGRRPQAVKALDTPATVRAALERTCEAMSALGHPHRAAMMAKLMEGPQSYRTLQQAMGLKAGPLYHHIRQLRLGGLILPKHRDWYAHTQAGRNLVMVMMALASLPADQRPNKLGLPTL